MFNNKQICTKKIIPMLGSPKGKLIIEKKRYTRKINPLLGLLGLLGIWGFNGFFHHKYGMIEVQPIPFEFIYFACFGFFGLYYEGKMSNTLIDERFEANSNKATAISNKIVLNIIVIVTFILPFLIKIYPYIMLCIVMATVGISWGLANFLKQYLLYRFENEEDEE